MEYDLPRLINSIQRNKISKEDIKLVTKAVQEYVKVMQQSGAIRAIKTKKVV